MYPVFLSSYTNTRESLGELEKACGSCSHSTISRSPKLPLVFTNSIETRYMFSFLKYFIGAIYHRLYVICIFVRILFFQTPL